MPASIEYYLTSVSPWAYLGHAAIRALAEKHGATLVIKPVNLGEMFKETGQVALAERPQVRQRYRFIELQRFADWRGLKITLKPKYFPTNPMLADHTICAILAKGGDPLDYMASVFSAVWSDDRDISDEETLADLLSRAGFDAAAVLESARTPEIATMRSRNTIDAIAVDATGVPCLVLNGEPFWGQDRLDLLDHALATGRPPFRAP